VTEPDTEPLLSAAGLSVRFGGLRALHDVDLTLHAGRVVGLIGPNGAGKSTLINLLTGHVRRAAGRVVLAGQDITGARPWRIAHAGVARTFQIVKPFRGMTVADNVLVAALYGPHRPRHARQFVDETLDQVGLGGKGDMAPAELSVADARRLELAKALALRPRVLLLDEVLAGLRPTEIGPALELIGSMRAEGLAILMVEHVVQAITAVADEILVLHHGEVLTRGVPEDVLSDSRVVEAYLGSRYAKNKARKEGP
jgi:branched-chain amino acid transport system ATP-binding protein